MMAQRVSETCRSKLMNKEEVIIISAFVGLHLFNTLMHGMENVITLHVSGTFRTHHQDYNKL
jgi:hypothetical protein